MSFLEFLFGPPKVEKLAARRDVDALIRVLSSGKPDWPRSTAAEVLGSLQAVSAVPCLTDALRDSDVRVSRAAARALGKIGAPHAIEPLIGALDLPSVRETAAESLLTIGEPVIPALIAALKNRGHSSQARMILVRLGKPAANALIRALGEQNEGRIVEDVLKEFGGVAAEPLILALADVHLHASASKLLVAIGEPAVVPLAHALAQPALRSQVSTVLCTMLDTKGKRAVSALIAAMNDQDPLRRRSIALALAQTGKMCALAPILRVKGIGSQPRLTWSMRFLLRMLRAIPTAVVVLARTIIGMMLLMTFYAFMAGVLAMMGAAPDWSSPYVRIGVLIVAGVGAIVGLFDPWGLARKR